jgi:BirA family biotin operon repressor/biotin-[acetyl-CoA-carboxylase] ligase
MDSTATSGAPWADASASSEVANALAHATLLWGIRPAGVVGSTQDVALELAGQGVAGGVVVVAEHQLSGRGRAGRRWDDVSAGGSLALTLLLDAPAGEHTLVPHAAGLAVREAIASSCGLKVALKWPNDIVVRADPAAASGRLHKLGGILVERERVAERDVLLVGIGLNVDHRAGSTIEDRTCLATLSGLPPQRSLLLATLITELDRVFVLLHGGSATLIDRYRAACETIGRRVSIDLPGGGMLAGSVEDVDDAGRLLVRTQERTEVVVAGTVRDEEGPTTTEGTG